jgi:hypothetical protein
MPTFAQTFGINKDQSQLDFVDVDPSRDLPLFIDPYVFGVSSGPWADTCNQAILSFFQTILDAIQARNDARVRQLLNHLGEPNETCLGVSSGRPAGRGIGGIQAGDIFERLQRSRAAQSGLLKELSECELFVDGIGPDKISDITTNIIRRQLIDYTREQCNLHGVELVGQLASGWLWDEAQRRWVQEYVELPVIAGRKIILVPKASVRWNLAFSHQEYYNKFVLEFLQAENLNQQTALVETLRGGRQRVTKRALKELHPLSKTFLAEFTEHNPEVLENYRTAIGVPRSVTNEELVKTFDEALFAGVLSDQLDQIRPGDNQATAFHDFMKGVLEFLFYPNLIYPEKEAPLHQGRKRIDVVFTNNSSGGFFYRRLIDRRSGARKVMFECKNYTKEMANPELDQIAGRFSPERGRLGFVIGRQFDDRTRFIARCRDTALDDRGYVIAVVDDDIKCMLSMVHRHQRSAIDQYLEGRFDELIR